jgi:hypothetical protein
MEKLSEEKIDLIRQLRKEGLNLEAIHRVTRVDKRVIRKYTADDSLYVTLPSCQCKPGMWIMPCPSLECSMAKGGQDEEVDP